MTDLGILNPYNWFDKELFYITGQHPIDLIDENPDDRAAYIPNQINKTLIETIDPITDPYTEPIKGMIIDDFESIEDSLGITHHADDRADRAAEVVR